MARSARASQTLTPVTTTSSPTTCPEVSTAARSDPWPAPRKPDSTGRFGQRHSAEGERAFISDFWGLVVLSVLSTLGVGAIVATHAVYMSEIVSHQVRNRVLLGAQSTTAIITVISGLLAFWLIPSHWQWCIYLMAASQLLVLFPLLYFRLPESPRWLEAHGRQVEAEKAVGILDRRCQRYVGGSLPEPDAEPRPVVEVKPGAWRELFSSLVYRQRTLILLAAWALGYAGIVYGAPSFAAVYMSEHGASAQFVFLLITISGVFRFGGTRSGYSTCTTTRRSRSQRACRRWRSVGPTVSRTWARGEGSP